MNEWIASARARFPHLGASLLLSSATASLAVATAQAQDPSTSGFSWILPYDGYLVLDGAPR